MVFQEYALFPHLTVEANIAFGLKRREKTKRLKDMLELVQLGDYAKRYPHELSGGQQQRVALARALAPNPSVLLMDEPFSNLDAELKLSIRGELREILHKSATTCLLVSHDQADIEAICSRSIRIGQSNSE
ncbi:Sulfate/thiosulfate import ATP-binding protein CysA [compost metagenome]